jgi:hypothetical protein
VKGGEMTQTLYAHMNKIKIQKIKVYPKGCWGPKEEKKKNTLYFTSEKKKKDGGLNLTNVQCKAIQECHNKSPCTINVC